MKLSNYINFKKGLSRKLLVTTLLLAIIPSLLIGGVSYLKANNALLATTISELEVISGLQSKAISNYFSRIKQDVLLESDRRNNSQFLEELIFSYEASGLSTHDFTASYPWALLTEEKSSDIDNFKNTYHYKNILLIDLDGNILYAVDRESNLGINLYADENKQTRFSTAARLALEKGHPIFSDFEFNTQSRDKFSGFMVNTLLDEYGEKIGLIAFEIDDHNVSKLLHEHGDNKVDIDTYLLGLDLVMRSNPKDTDRSHALSTIIKADNLINWVSSYKKNPNHTISNKPIYSNYINKEVQSVITPVKVANVTYLIIAEEEVSKIYGSSNELGSIIISLVIMTIVLSFLITLQATKKIVDPVLSLLKGMTLIKKGDFSGTVDIQGNDEIGELANGFNQMASSLQTNNNESAEQAWLQTGLSQLNEEIRGNLNIANLSRNIIQFICQYISAPIGAIYLVQDDNIKLSGSYAFKARKSFTHEFKTGEGIVGQAVYEQQNIILTAVPDDYFAIASGLGETTPKTLNIVPIVWNNTVIAVLEIGTTNAFTDLEEKLIGMLNVSIAIAFSTAFSRDNTALLLEQTQVQSEELQAREEELQESNGSLQTQQEELRATNEELETKASELEESASVLEEKNHALDVVKHELENKASDLEQSSQYKSEFLSNMSHELRTPLNSLLILAKLLADNKGDNLDSKQVEYASTIHDSGTDLLNLINDILDLSKIESGKMEVHVEPVVIEDFSNDLKRKFNPLAEQKGLQLVIENDFSEKTIHSDGHKIAQIIKNLLSNAFKFTASGKITLKFSDVDNSITTQLPRNQLIQISVTDTGIGIPEDKQASIFEAFQQEDGTTNRKYGGTGLGLSISRELAKLLQGEIHLSSTKGAGSTFSLLLNKSMTLVDNEASITFDEIQHNPPPVVRTSNVEGVRDDRNSITKSDLSLLIIEDDVVFASLLVDAARAKGFKALVADDGETGLQFADYYKPTGIILDIGLPGIDGWEVMRRLKDNLETRHIPVHFMSGNDKTMDAMRTGALGYLTKPISMDQIEQSLSKITDFVRREVKHLLVIEDNKIQSDSIIALVENDDILVTTVATGAAAIEKMQQQAFDCIVLDLGLPDIDGAELLEKIRADENLIDTPIVIYSGRDLAREEKALIEQFANRIIIKNARSPEILLDDTALFLHRVASKMSQSGQDTLRMLHDKDSVLENRNILVVDDDMRNVFALSTLLRDRDMNVVAAKNGIDALEKLDNMDVPDMILMDIMMPEMDGYEAMQKIREQQQYDKLPIIALTAKAMKGDRAKCIEAGANDYLSKPIDTDKLLSMMRVWLYR